MPRALFRTRVPVSRRGLLEKQGSEDVPDQPGSQEQQVVEDRRHKPGQHGKSLLRHLSRDVLDISGFDIREKEDHDTQEGQHVDQPGRGIADQVAQLNRLCEAGRFAGQGPGQLGRSPLKRRGQQRQRE